MTLNAEHPGCKSGSSHSAPVILLKGRRGIGKTTAIQQVVKTLGNRAGGFYTCEVRTQARAAGRRTGFELVTLAAHCTHLCVRKRNTIITGTVGSMVVANERIVLDGEEMEVSMGPAMEHQLREFFDAIAEGREPEASGANVRRTMQALEAARLSIASRQVVSTKSMQRHGRSRVLPSAGAKENLYV
jgi:predicted dehydrogenase